MASATAAASRVRSCAARARADPLPPAAGQRDRRRGAAGRHLVRARCTRRQLLGALEADMVHQAELVRAIVLAEPDRPLADFEPTLGAAATETRTRIRLLDAGGAVRADSHRDGPPEGAERPAPRLLRGEPPRHTAGPPKPVDPASRARGPDRARRPLRLGDAAVGQPGSRLPVLRAADRPRRQRRRRRLRDRSTQRRQAPALPAARLAVPPARRDARAHRARQPDARDHDRAPARAAHPPRPADRRAPARRARDRLAERPTRSASSRARSRR